MPYVKKKKKKNCIRSVFDQNKKLFQKKFIISSLQKIYNLST